MDSLLIGIDGGQTSVKCALATGDGAIVGTATGGGLIHLSREGSRENFVRVVGDAINGAFAAAHIQPQAVAAITLGLSGVEAGSREDAIVRELLPHVLSAERTHVCHDGITALAGAHDGAAGVIVISGTGSIVIGTNGEITRRVGGWGWLVGDEGSAQWIGRQGIRAALQYEDGYGEATQLHPDFLNHYKIAAFKDLKRVVYASDFGSRGFAEAASVVSNAAAAGDDAAQKIISDSARWLAKQTASLIDALGLHNAQIATMSGGCAHIYQLRELYIGELRLRVADAYVVEPKHSALEGAVLMARNLMQNRG
jgi:N-acetylglucosamine kinase